MQFHRGLGRYVYLPPLPGPEEMQEAAEIEAIAAEPHALELAEMEMPPEEEEGEGDAMPAEPAEIQAGLFGGE
jgi:hypothetical protein